MEIADLKKKLETNKIDGSFMIFLLSNDTNKTDQNLEDLSSYIIAEQYINRICELRHLNRKIIDSISEIPDNSFIIDDNLYIIKTDEWKTSEKHNNCIVICKSTKEQCIKIPPLQEWQIIDYVIPILSGLEKSEIEDFIKRYTTSHGTNYQRFLKDVEKLGSIEKSRQSLIYHQMLDYGELDTATNLTIFNLSDAVTKRDVNMVKTILDKLKYVKDGTVKNDYYIDIEPLGLWTLLYREFKRLLVIKTDPHCNYLDVGCKSEKQLWYIKTYKSNYYTVEQIENILKMLTNIEYMFKLGGVEQNQLIDYMIVKILGE